MPSSRQHKRVTWRIVHTTLVCAHAEEAAHDEEWDVLLELIRKPKDYARILVFTYGGAPNATQRAHLTDILKHRRIPVSVLTPSLLARGAGTALHWFNPLLRVFDPDDVDGALLHIETPRADQHDVLDALAELKAEVSRR
jgi:hypothetical protein